VKQNIYDDPIFFNGYKQLRETGSNLNNILEQPALKAALPDLQHKRILDLGSGMGHFAMYCIRKGALKVTGVEISKNMISYAKLNNRHEKIEYILSPIEDQEFLSESFDLIVSSLTLHYIKNYESIIEKVYKWLINSGLFIFTIEHPVCTAMNPMDGWIKDEVGNKLYWPIDHYGTEGKRVSRWFVDGVVKYHRKISTLVNGLLFTGFKIVQMIEPDPTQEALAQNPNLISEIRRPPFLIIKSEKPL